MSLTRGVPNEFEPQFPEAFYRVVIHAQLWDAGAPGSTRARGRFGGAKVKPSEKQVREIKTLLRNPEIQVSDVARRHGVSRTAPYNMRTSPRLIINRGFSIKRMVGGRMTGKLGE